MTHQERLKRQRELRKLNKNRWTKKYEKTPNGFLMRVYRNMQSRVTGVQWKKQHLYKDLDLLPRAEFYSWSLNNADFWRLFSNWKQLNCKRVLTPSVDRIDSSKGYHLSNMRWVTFSENCKNVRR